MVYGHRRLFCLVQGHTSASKCGCSQGQLFRLQISFNTGGLRYMGEIILISLWALLEEITNSSVDT